MLISPLFRYISKPGHVDVLVQFKMLEYKQKLLELWWQSQSQSSVRPPRQDQEESDPSRSNPGGSGETLQSAGNTPTGRSTVVTLHCTALPYLLNELITGRSWQYSAPPSHSGYCKVRPDWAVITSGTASPRQGSFGTFWEGFNNWFLPAEGEPHTHDTMI